MNLSLTQKKAIGNGMIEMNDRERKTLQLMQLLFRCRRRRRCLLSTSLASSNILHFTLFASFSLYLSPLVLDNKQLANILLGYQSLQTVQCLKKKQKKTPFLSFNTENEIAEQDSNSWLLRLLESFL